MRHRAGRCNAVESRPGPQRGVPEPARRGRLDDRPNGVGPGRERAAVAPGDRPQAAGLVEAVESAHAGPELPRTFREGRRLMIEGPSHALDQRSRRSWRTRRVAPPAYAESGPVALSGPACSHGPRCAPSGIGTRPGTPAGWPDARGPAANDRRDEKESGHGQADERHPSPDHAPFHVGRKRRAPPLMPPDTGRAPRTRGGCAGLALARGVRPRARTECPRTQPGGSRSASGRPRARARARPGPCPASLCPLSAGTVRV